MSEAVALIEEVKRLSLENERLKAALVFMDREFELHPRYVDLKSQSGRSIMELNPWTASVEIDNADFMGHGKSDAVARIYESAALKFAKALLVSNSAYVQLSPSPGNVLTISARIGAWIMPLGR